MDDYIAPSKSSRDQKVPIASTLLLINNFIANSTVFLNRYKSITIIIIISSSLLYHHHHHLLALLKVVRKEFVQYQIILQNLKYY